MALEKLVAKLLFVQYTFACHTILGKQTNKMILASSQLRKDG